MRHEAKAIGAGSEGAQSELEDKWNKVCPHIADSAFDSRMSNFAQSMSLGDAHVLALRVLKQVMEEKLDEHNVQLAQGRPPF